MKKEKMGSLQALRAWAFIGIFLGHAQASVAWPALGVTVFFVLSGFLLVYIHLEDSYACSVKDNLQYAIHKIAKLYPLHIITMLLASGVMLMDITRQGWSLSRVASLGVKFILNVLLLQAWIPYSAINYSFNGVAWFLSVMLFLYFVFPFLLRVIQKFTKNSQAVLVIVIALILQVAVAVGTGMVFGTDGGIFDWAVYVFPVFRLADFGVGCCLGYIVRNSRQLQLSKTTSTMLEGILLIVTVVFVIWSLKMPSGVGYRLLGNGAAWNTFLACAWIVLALNEKGWIGQVLGNKCLVTLGNISAYTYLIHYVICKYATVGLDTYFLHKGLGWEIVFVSALFIITLACTYLYMAIKKVVINKKRKYED